MREAYEKEHKKTIFFEYSINLNQLPHLVNNFHLKSLFLKDY